MNKSLSITHRQSMASNPRNNPGIPSVFRIIWNTIIGPLSLSNQVLKRGEQQSKTTLEFLTLKFQNWTTLCPWFD